MWLHSSLLTSFPFSLSYGKHTAVTPPDAVKRIKYPPRHVQAYAAVKNHISYRPESDHCIVCPCQWLSQSLSDALETWLICDSGCWRCQLITCCCCPFCWCWHWTLKRVYTIGWWQLTAWKQQVRFGNSWTPAFQNLPILTSNLLTCLL